MFGDCAEAERCSVFKEQVAGISAVGGVLPCVQGVDEVWQDISLGRGRKESGIRPALVPEIERRQWLWLLLLLLVGLRVVKVSLRRVKVRMN